MVLTGVCASLFAVDLEEDQQRQEDQPSVGRVRVFPRMQWASAEVGGVEHPGGSSALEAWGPAGASNAGDRRDLRRSGQ
ncbi:unnamed protein product [Lota lota]